LGQSFPCPKAQARFGERLSALEVHVASVKPRDLQPRIGRFEDKVSTSSDHSCQDEENNPRNGASPETAIIRHVHSVLDWSSTLCGVQKGCAESCKTTGVMVQKSQADGKLADPGVREFLAKTEELMAIVGPIGENLEQHFREMQDAFDEKFTAATTLTSRQVEVLVDKRFNALCRQRGQMLVPNSVPQSATMNSSRSQRTIWSSHRDDLRAETTASAVAAAAAEITASAAVQETTNYLLDHTAPSQDDHVALSSSYPTLAHHRRVHESKDAPLKLTSSYPSLPAAQSGPPGCAVRPTVSPPWTQDGLSGL